MSKLKVGTYVRTKEWGIQKIAWFDNEEPIMECGFTVFQKSGYKTSDNIIDLIELGDYVNGYPVYEIVEYEDNTRAIVIGDDNKSIIWEESSQYVKSIVTKEQFEAMTYKVSK